MCSGKAELFDGMIITLYPCFIVIFKVVLVIIVLKKQPVKTQSN
jgi:hypothetical protein